MRNHPNWTGRGCSVLRVAVLVPCECGFMCGLRFLSVCRSRCTSNFRAVCGFRRNILFLVKNLEYFFDKGRWKHKSKRVQCVQITQTARNCTHCTPLPPKPQSSAPSLTGSHSKLTSTGEGGRGVRKSPKRGRLLFFHIANSELLEPIIGNNFTTHSFYNKEQGTSK